ncbi:helix-turn-helix domain-containing protein [Megasphaera elsdenii]|uniref:helix-turn-helix domain-containing protein n=1 Tax=Megasphaera elsdenii TaxID=907 RepID=UPI004036F1F3
MNYMNTFSMRMRALRTAYNLSLDEMAGILSLKNKASLYSWENQKNAPLLENLVNIADFFGISIDWLIGRSEDIYTESSMRSGEIALYTEVDNDYIGGREVGDGYRISFLHAVELVSCGYYLNLDGVFDMTEYDLRVEKCVDCNVHKEYYPLSVRANLLVLLHLVSTEDLYWAYFYVINGKNKRGVLTITKDKLLRIFGSRISDPYKEPGKKAQERAINLVELLRPSIESKIPVYDVEETLRKLEKEKLQKIHDEIKNLNTAKKDRDYGNLINKKTNKLEL